MPHPISRKASIPLRRAVLLCLLVAPLGCDRTPPAERVVLRLGPQDFAVGQPRAHMPVAAIADQAREVVIDRDPIPVAQIPEVRFERSTARVDVTLPEPAVGLPDSALVLAVYRRPAAVKDDLARKVAQGLNLTHVPGFVVLDAGWRLERERAESASVALRID